MTPAAETAGARSVFANTPDACAQARDFVRESMAGVGSDALEDALVMTSELVGNVVRYTDGPVTVSVSVGATSAELRVAVGDTSPVRIARRPSLPAAGQTHGRGLVIVQALASTWGVEYGPDRSGKTVWFEVRR